jgi:hypothetical protein
MLPTVQSYAPPPRSSLRRRQAHASDDSRINARNPEWRYDADASVRAWPGVGVHFERVWRDAMGLRRPPTQGDVVAWVNRTLRPDAGRGLTERVRGWLTAWCRNPRAGTCIEGYVPRTLNARAVAALAQLARHQWPAMRRVRWDAFLKTRQPGPRRGPLARFDVRNHHHDDDGHAYPYDARETHTRRRGAESAPYGRSVEGDEGRDDPRVWWPCSCFRSAGTCRHMSRRHGRREVVPEGFMMDQPLHWCAWRGGACVDDGVVRGGGVAAL